MNVFASGDPVGHVKKQVSLDGLATPIGGLAEGQSVGSWQLLYSGFGKNQILPESGINRFELCPQASPNPGDEDHAALVIGELFGDNLVYSLTVRNDERLHYVGEQQHWHAPWTLWHIVDKDNYYYFITKTNGFELGKVVNGKQQFLQTGAGMTFQLGQAYDVEVRQSGGHIQVKVDGRQLVDYTDANPFTAGRIGLYTECSRVSFWNIAADGD